MAAAQGHGRRLLQTALLTSIALGGLLLMHGFEGAALALFEGEDAEMSHQGPDMHGGFGLCVFVVSIIGIGVAAMRARTRKFRSRPQWRSTPLRMGRPHWLAHVGRDQLILLQVIRL